MVSISFSLFWLKYFLLVAYAAIPNVCNLLAKLAMYKSVLKIEEKNLLISIPRADFFQRTVFAYYCSANIHNSHITHNFKSKSNACEMRGIASTEQIYVYTIHIVIIIKQQHHFVAVYLNHKKKKQQQF